MEDIYYKKLLDKPSHQLEQLIGNKSKYTIEAVNSAIRILNERDGQSRKTVQDVQSPRVKSTAEEFEWITKCFSKHPYFKQFNGWDIINPAIAALLCLTLNEVVDWYSNETYMETARRLLRAFGPMVIVLTSHLFYRLEHGVSNNLLGRTINDTMFGFSWFLFHSLYKLFIYGTKTETVEEGFFFLFGYLIAIFFSAFVFEIGVGIFKSIFRLFKWHVL
ncbi:hypothetical protein RT717_13370 [Imperialibacter roseus]|uniref:Uncharacterized protein n=1 Tax=Imperialibacter roseus TaxID=1324217 RepID=A0ABZ0IX33_9BACT|nr:hypothetical protein [Imperialibacter roseus]WOK09630.1 hypothetical protein RT717_13370 [Imperialibacter roseus]